MSINTIFMKWRKSVAALCKGPNTSTWFRWIASMYFRSAFLFSRMRLRIGPRVPDKKLTGTEEYAVAKMRLFQAFDEIEGLAAKTPELSVDSSNLETLLTQLDI